MTSPETPKQKPNGFWAIVEIFGHQRIAGFLSEEAIGGQGFVRIDVPELPQRMRDGIQVEGPVAAHSKLFGAGAIYAITPVDEILARAAAAQIRHKPLDTYGVEAVLRNMTKEHRDRLLTGPDHHDQEDEAHETFR